VKGLNILFVVQWKPANTITSGNNVVLTRGRERGRWVVGRDRGLLYYKQRIRESLFKAWLESNLLSFPGSSAVCRGVFPVALFTVLLFVLY